MENAIVLTIVYGLLLPLLRDCLRMVLLSDRPGLWSGPLSATRLRRGSLTTRPAAPAPAERAGPGPDVSPPLLDP